MQQILADIWRVLLAFGLPFRDGMKLANNALHYLHEVLAAILIASHLVLVPV